ncbi:MAG: hypothetical protein ACC645_21065, partial [Pirellulales bacterium]
EDKISARGIHMPSAAFGPNTVAGGNMSPATIAAGPRIKTTAGNSHSPKARLLPVAPDAVYLSIGGSDVSTEERHN